MTKLPVKERLVKTATRLFYEKGYNSTGINEILRESGVAKASMYQHFRSKEELCVAYLQYMDEVMMNDLQGFLDSIPQGPERMLGIMDFVLEFFQRDYYRGCWCLNTISEIPKSNELLIEEIRAQKQGFRDFLLSLVEENLQAAQPEILADRLYLLYEAALMESQVFMADWPIEEARAMYERLIAAEG